MYMELPVVPSNSTVNGQKANPRHDARHYLDGWKNLGIQDTRVYKDGKVEVFGEYLHVPILGPNADDAWYRVQCRARTGQKFRGKQVLSVAVKKKPHQGWFWVIHFEEERERKNRNNNRRASH
jgi:hypothetical protein